MADYAKLCRKNQQSNKSDAINFNLNFWQQNASSECYHSLSYTEIPERRQGPDTLSIELDKERAEEIQNKIKETFDTPIKALDKCKAGKDLSKNLKRALLFNTDYPGSTTEPNANDLEKSENRISYNPNALSPSLPNDNLVSRSSPSVDISDIDFKFIKVTGNNLGSVEDDTNEFF